MTDQVRDQLATYAAEASDQLDQRAEHEIVRRYLDAFGCALRAFDHPGPIAARNYVKGHRRDDGPVVWGTQLRTHPEAAALVNGATVRYLDLNDSFFSRESLHPSDMLAGILAVGEQMGATGRDVVVASAVAYEVAMTLCDAFCVHCNGWDHVNVTGIGACAGIGRLLGLDVGQLGHALALQVTPHVAMRQTRFGDLSMWKGFAAGDAVRQAVYACSLARSGVEGPAQAFEGRYGFVNQLLDGEVPGIEALDDLDGARPPRRVLDSHIKVWPFGYVAQSAVEAASLLRDRLDDPEDVARIDVTTFAEGKEFMSSPEKWRPTTRETADHSLPYVVGEMVRRGAVDESSFEPERFGTPETHAYLQEKVFVHVDDGFSERYGPEFPVRVVITTADGTRHEQELDVSAGHAKRPLSDEELKAKFRVGADVVLGVDGATRLVETTMALGQLEDVRDLTRLLAG